MREARFAWSDERVPNILGMLGHCGRVVARSARSSFVVVDGKVWRVVVGRFIDRIGDYFQFMNHIRKGSRRGRSSFVHVRLESRHR